MAGKVVISDESEPSWLELKDLELGSARLGSARLGSARLGSARDLFPFSSKSKIGRKRAEILILFVFLFSFM
jgi:hypothetical protein